MALAEQQVVVRFEGGIETQEDEKGVLPTKLLALENSVFTKSTSLVKRNGYEDLKRFVLGGGQMPTARALGRRGSELLALTEDKAYSRVGEKWAEAGEMRSVIVDHEPVAKTGSNQTLATMASTEGVALYGWEDSRGGIWYSLVDDTTGRTLVAPTQVHASGERPRALAIGGRLHLLYVLPPAREMRSLSFAASTPLGAPTARILLSDLSSTHPVYDVDSDGEKGLMAWIAQGDRIGVAYIHSSGVIGGSGLGLPTPQYHDAPGAEVVAIALDKRPTSVLWAQAGWLQANAFQGSI